MMINSSEESEQEVEPDDFESCLPPTQTQDPTISGDGFGDKCGGGVMIEVLLVRPLRHSHTDQTKDELLAFYFSNNRILQLGITVITLVRGI